MKFLIPVFLLALAAVSSSSVSLVTRNNLNIGVTRSGDRALRRFEVYKLPLPNTVQYDDIVYTGSRNTRISSISVNRIGANQFATVQILRGGVGTNHVTIRIRSAPGRGYHFSITIYGYLV